MIAFVGVLAAAVLQAVAEFPSWAYGVTAPPAAGGRRPALQLQHRPRAVRAPVAVQLPQPTRHCIACRARRKQFTRAQISNQYGPADWYPGDHPQMPEIVAKGKAGAERRRLQPVPHAERQGTSGERARCGFPVEYFVKTMMDFKNDLRKSSDPRKANTNRMIAFAKR
jgi:hypothetical protein